MQLNIQYYFYIEYTRILKKKIKTLYCQKLVISSFLFDKKKILYLKIRLTLFFIKQNKLRSAPQKAFASPK